MPGCVGLTVLGLVAPGVFGPRPVMLDSAGPARLSVPGGVAGFAAAVAGSTSSWFDDGVRLLKPSPRPQHTVLQPR